uniref:F-box only protein 42-like n=1 Tax=Styela clava TaxID=7725 RepID=UPI00193ADDC8|nr:F-box only protein 42-like [Styela clava]
MKPTIESLPEEILEKVFLNLSPYQEYDNVALVCKQWRRVIAGVASQLQKRFEEAFNIRKLAWTEVCLNVSRHPANSSFMSPRLLHSMCYNDETRSVYVFGGRSVGSQSAGFNDLWRLNMHTKRWERPIIYGDFPRPKFGCSLESYKNVLVLYGGRSMPRSAPFVLYHPDYCSDELHIFDTHTSKWKLKQSIQDAPPALYLHGSCIVANQSEDGDECMLIFGGIKERGGGDSSEIWCLDLPTYNWWKPTIIGPPPEARHMHTQAAFRSEYTFSSAVLIVGGSTTENRILTDAWILTRSGFREWTSTSLAIRPGPRDFLPQISVFKRSGVKVGQNLIFFGSTPSNKASCKRKSIRRFYPYEDQEIQSVLNGECNNILERHRNPLCVYILNLSRTISDNILTWKTSLSENDNNVDCNMLGPDKPNYHLAVVARGEIVVHGDFPLENPQVIERTFRQSHNFLNGMGSNKWTPLYFLSANIT